MPIRIAFVSPSGLGNLGDAAIIDSLIAGIRARVDAEIVGFTLNPSDTEVRHGVEAATCGAFPLPHYGIRPRSQASPTTDDDAPGAPPSFARRIKSSLAAIPGARDTRRFARMAVAELRHRRMVAARIRGFDHVVVAGGGQLDDFWGGPFGHPYTLYRWSGAARRAGARFAIMSVGTGSLSTRASRRFVAGALAGAAYRSFRDARSRELAAAAGATEHDLIVPDLAYALPFDAGVTPTGAIGVAPMCYADPRVWPKPDAALYTHHITSLAGIAVRMVRAGRDVVMFGTDRPDRAPVAECYALAVGEVGADRIRVVTPESTQALMQLIGSLDAVVAARFHGVLLAHVAGKPVLAVSHERKVATLMNEMGHQRYCLPIDTIDPAAGAASLEALLSDRGAVGAQIRTIARTYRRRVEDQYDQVFGRAR